MTARNQTHFSVILSDILEILLIKAFTTNQVTDCFQQPHGMFLFNVHDC